MLAYVLNHSHFVLRAKHVAHIILGCKPQAPINAQKKLNEQRTTNSLMDLDTPPLKSKTSKSVSAVLDCPLLVKSL